MDEAHTVRTKALASVLGITDVRIGQLVAEGVLEKKARGEFALIPTIRRYISYLQRRKTNQWSAPDTDADYEKERALLTRAKREEAEIRAAVLKGKVHEAAAVAEIWIAMLMAARAKLLAIPTKAAPQVAPENAAEAMEILTSLVHEALSELADYDPSSIAARTDLKRLTSEP